MRQPKILVIVRGAWDDTKGASGTVSNLFMNADPERTACIYIESKKPKSNYCRFFYQISEIALVKKLYRWRIKTGKRLDLSSENVIYFDEKTVEQEEKTMNYVRGHRSHIYTWLREMLWGLNGWKTKELKYFITDFNPDVIWFFGSPLVLMNKIASYVIRTCNKPAGVFLMDDAYTYIDEDKGPIAHFYKSRLRKSIREVVGLCTKVFVISPKMKKEYDKAFGVDSVFITKGIDFSKKHFEPLNPHKPLRMVYMGQVIYGRIYSLIAMASAIKEFNIEETRLTLDIYTTNSLNDSEKSQLLVTKDVNLQKPVPFSKVEETIAQYDVVVFVESFEKKFKNAARLSFSTKITDYLGSGKCIFAVGPSNIAPIEYLVDEDAAIVATSLDEIGEKMKLLCNDDLVKQFAQKAFECGVRNHSNERIRQEVYDKFLNQYSY